mmetsp:Transcript_72941/g.163729  ORF Transcript_72941/g.163729 Transcript_72941/m.163729 type:complete len:238 (+) Transcript_72941:610-1323(+)
MIDRLLLQQSPLSCSFPHPQHPLVGVLLFAYLLHESPASSGQLPLRRTFRSRATGGVHELQHHPQLGNQSPGLSVSGQSLVLRLLSACRSPPSSPLGYSACLGALRSGGCTILVLTPKSLGRRLLSRIPVTAPITAVTSSRGRNWMTHCPGTSVQGTTGCGGLRAGPRSLRQHCHRFLRWRLHPRPLQRRWRHRRLGLCGPLLGPTCKDFRELRLELSLRSLRRGGVRQEDEEGQKR